MASDKTTKPTYKIVGVVPGIVYYQGKEVDLRTLTEAQASKMANDPKCPYVVVATE